MLSIERCKTILNKKHGKYSLEEIKLIREYLYKLANIEYQLLNDL
jgi:hypothetical protein